MNYSIDPLRVDSSEDLKLPASITDIAPKASAAVTVTKKHIVVGDKEIVKLEESGFVSKDDKEDLDEKKLKIEPLFRALTDEANRQKEMARLRGAKFDGVMTVIATETTNYRLSLKSCTPQDKPNSPSLSLPFSWAAEAVVRVR